MDLKNVHGYDQRENKKNIITECGTERSPCQNEVGKTEQNAARQTPEPDNRDFIHQGFEPGLIATGEKETDLCFIFFKSRLLVKNGKRLFEIPSRRDLAKTGLTIPDHHFMGLLDGISCFWGEVFDEWDLENRAFNFKALRDLYNLLSAGVLPVASMALQLRNWDRISRFCGRCGNPLTRSDTERAKLCAACGHVDYPRINPAVIVAVTKGSEILLVRPRRVKNSLYSVIAGYLEPGETLEEAVSREIREETGVEVDNIRYFGNQPWPFGNSLMVAFTADYASGDISMDESEIVDAGWYHRDALPQVPGWGSIARRLIDDFVHKKS